MLPVTRPLQPITPSHLEEDDTSDVDVEVNAGTDINFEQTVSDHYKKKLVKTCRPGVLQKILNSPDVTSAVDRAKLSTRKFTMIAAAIARACDEDVRDTPISRSTVSRRRCENRQEIVRDIRQEFKSSIETSAGLIVHWDGKIMKNCNDAEKCTEEDQAEKVDRIATVVTGFYCYFCSLFVFCLCTTNSSNR